MVAQKRRRGGSRGLQPVTFQQAAGGPQPRAVRQAAKKARPEARFPGRLAARAQKRSTASLTRTMSPSVWPLPLMQCRRYGRAVVVLVLASTSMV
jgi:hypothetical protein